MKQKITLLVLAAVCVFKTNGQLILSQSFNNPATITATAIGWVKINNSQPLGTTSWFSGNPNVFPAYSGGDTSYIAANYNNTLGNSGAISNWLITPTVTLANGGVIQFATRTNTATPQTIAPDRLELYVSTAGTGSNVGTTSTSLGTFSTMLVSVNPNLTTSGYPTIWTVYTATLSNITGTVTGRFGFRYDVTSAGPTGTNSSYIGIDEVIYSLPCSNPTLSVSSSTTGICSGDFVTLTGSGANTYTWSTGSTSSSVTVFPTTNTTYTVTGSSIPNCNSTTIIAITATLTPNLSVTDVTTCVGTAATLAVSGASSYSWSTGSLTDSIVVIANADSAYTVTGYNGTCSQIKVVSVTVGPFLSINATASQTTVCAGRSATVMASGASTYTWNHGSSLNSPKNVVTPSVTTNYIVSASTSSGNCLGMDSVLIYVIPSPTVSIVGSPALSANSITICAGSVITLTASGAASFSWTGTSNATNILSIISPSINGTYFYNVVGTATNGCMTTASVSALVNACTGIESLQPATAIVSVFPNPFSNELRISNVSGTVELYNALGQMVLKQPVNGQESLQTEAFPKGIYVLKAFNAENKVLSTTKLIKN